MPAGPHLSTAVPAGEASTGTSTGSTSFMHSQSTGQYKVCADCGLRIPCEQAVIFQLLDTCLVVCSDCRWTRLGVDSPRPPHAPTASADVGSDAPASGDLTQEIHLSRQPVPTLHVQEADLEVSTPVAGPSRIPRLPSPRPLSPSNIPTTQTASTTISTHSTSSTHSPLSTSPSQATSPRNGNGTPRKKIEPEREHRTEPNPTNPSDPSPYTDITRLRVKRPGKHCLYPGSTFRGVQKSGRSDYDVTVTIVDVDFPTSFLCGYLEIRGLTPEWPRLTTYFDAEIIGSKYSFLTHGWGATHENDLRHWAQFPLFGSKEVQGDLEFPRYTLRDPGGVAGVRGGGYEERERGCVFMRWKEKFLVPDHRVKDINGASFAGFYYICVDFEPPIRLDCGPVTSEPPRSEVESDSRTKWDDEPIPASMTGFYFHKHSEPNQQLALHHVPDDVMGMGNGSFEWR